VLLEGAYRWPAPTGPEQKERVMSPQGAQPVYRTKTESVPQPPASQHWFPAGSIVVGVDGSTSALQAVRWAAGVTPAARAGVQL